MAVIADLLAGLPPQERRKLIAALPPEQRTAIAQFIIGQQ